MNSELTASGLSVRSTIESCLGYADAKSIQLVAKEFVDATPAWHVHVLSKHDESLDFWMDAAHPERVLKHAKGRDVVVSTYGPADPVPMEVSSEEFRNGTPLMGQRCIRPNARFDVPVDPVSFTLAGPGLPDGHAGRRPYAGPRPRTAAGHP